MDITKEHDIKNIILKVYYLIVGKISIYTFNLYIKFIDNKYDYQSYINNFIVCVNKIFLHR